MPKVIQLVIIAFTASQLPAIASGRIDDYLGTWHTSDLTTAQNANQQDLSKNKSMIQLDIPLYQCAPSDVVKKVLSIDSPFESRKWKEDSHKFIWRKRMLGSFLRENPVIGMERVAIHDQLGEPDHHWTKLNPDRARLNTEWYSIDYGPVSCVGWRNSAAVYLELGYQDQKVAGYRIVVRTRKPNSY